MKTSDEDVRTKRKSQSTVQTKICVMEGGEPLFFWRRFGSMYGEDQGSSNVGICSCGCAK